MKCESCEKQSWLLSYSHKSQPVLCKKKTKALKIILIINQKERASFTYFFYSVYRSELPVI